MRDHLERLIFIDETSLKTNMTKAAGWAPEGTRLIDHAPAGHWNTQTFIAGLRHDKIDATGIISGPMDKEMFDLYVESTLAPTLRPGDVVILDNLPAHRSTVAVSILKEIGAWFLFLPKYSPDLDPIEMALSYDFFRLLGHNGAAIRDLKMPDSGGGWIASSLVYKDR